MAKVSEVRTQIYLTREKHQALRRVARAREISMAHLVREAVDSYLAEHDGGSDLHGKGDTTDPIWSLPERAVDFGHEDASRDHDALLYGDIHR